MKKTFIIIAAAAALLTSCDEKKGKEPEKDKEPEKAKTVDLVVESITPDANWATGTHKATVTIKNIGDADATGNFLLYVEGHNSSTTAGQISAQVSKQYTGLAAGASDVFTADFVPGTFANGHTMADVIKVHAVVDAKVMVAESNEANNTKTVNVP